jgi:hypothetical protein
MESKDQGVEAEIHEQDAQKGATNKNPVEGRQFQSQTGKGQSSSANEDGKDQPYQPSQANKSATDLKSDDDRKQCEETQTGLQAHTEATDRNHPRQQGHSRKNAKYSGKTLSVYSAALPANGAAEEMHCVEDEDWLVAFGVGKSLTRQA